MKYQIKYNYNTGSSFTQEDGLEDTLELEWENLEVAKANLKRIEAHYQQYKDLKSYGRKGMEILEKNSKEDWFVRRDRLLAYKGNKNDWTPVDEKNREIYEKDGYTVLKSIDFTLAQYEIKLYTDEGKVWQIWAPWCGYFEKLNFIEIVTDHSDTKIYL